MRGLSRRLERVDAAAGPHLGQRIDKAYAAALRTLHDDELERLMAVLDLEEGDPLRDEIQARANALGESLVAGSTAWHEAFSANASRWPRDGFPAPRVEWARVPFTEPPRVPPEALRQLQQAGRNLPAGTERDAHLVAYVALSTMHALA